MLKRWFLFLAVLCLSLFCLSCASADGVIFTLYETDADGITVYEIPAFVTGSYTLIVPDVLPMNEGDRYFLKENNFECTPQQITAGKLTLSTEQPLGESLNIGNLDLGEMIVVTDEDLDLGIITGTVHWRGETCGLMDSPAASVGDLVCSFDGNACGLVCAEWVDQDGFYVVLPINMMASEAALQPSIDTWVIPELTADKDIVSIQWLSAPDQPSTLFIMQESNYYFNCYQTMPGTSSVSFTVVPGQQVAVWVYTGEVNTNAFSTQYPCAVMDVPFPAAFSDYGFTNHCTVGSLPADTDPNAPDLTMLSADVFSSAKLLSGEEQLCLEVLNTYDVAEKTEYELLFVLTTPDGQVWKDLATFIFDPTLCKNDLWRTGLGTLMERSRRVGDAPATGTFSITYFIDGQLGGTCSFTVK